MELLNFEIDSRIAHAETLPADCYANPVWGRLEEERIFNRSWQLIGRVDQLPAVGSYLTAEIGRAPLVVVRGADEKIRGFINICRHRAGPLARGTGSCQKLRCGYHGWTYDLTGRLIGRPDFEGVIGLTAEETGTDKMDLLPVEIACWEQFIFARVATGPAGLPTLAEMLGEIPAVTGHCRIPALRPAGRRDYVIECNWKVYVDNYVEGYHIPIIHPGLMREIDYQRYRTLTGRYHSRQDAPIRTGPDERRHYQTTAAQTDALYFWIFPNLMLNIYPDNLSTNLIIPLGPDRTLTIFEWYFHDVESAAARARIEAAIALSDEIQQEDIRICEEVQRGLGSGLYHRGRYSPRRENGLHHFHSLWLEWMRM
jgi:choline monooxygenase